MEQEAAAEFRCGAQPIDAAVREQRPPHLPLELPQCPAKDLKVPEGYVAAVCTGHGELWKDSIAQEWCGGSEAGIIDTAECQPVENYVHAK